MQGYRISNAMYRENSITDLLFGVNFILSAVLERSVGKIKIIDTESYRGLFLYIAFEMRCTVEVFYSMKKS